VIPIGRPPFSRVDRVDIHRHREARAYMFHAEVVFFGLPLRLASVVCGDSATRMAQRNASARTLICNLVVC
jgi:hypothetical protein